MNDIHSVVPDIYAKITSKDGWFDPELAQAFSQDVAERLRIHLNENKGPPRLRLSQMGPKCHNHLWQSIHNPHLAEPLPPQAMIKFSYGHILEALAIVLAKAAGHEVTGEQDELSVLGVTGHRDLVLDGCICDVKSCSSYAFSKFKEGTIRQDDSFGYLDQLDGYLCGSLEDPLVRVKDKAYILAIDKVLGNMVLYQHEFRHEHIVDRISEYKEIVNRSTPPKCTCGTKPSGKSGNFELDVRASYSPYKWTCFPNLRCFVYADGLKYLTTVVRKPDVPEIDRYGNPV